VATKADPPTFHPFPRLPAELRVYIWALAIPRDYLDATLAYPIGIQSDSVRRSGYRVIPARKSPVLFTVNCEARSETARVDRGQWYPLDLSNHSGDAGGPRVYVNFKKEASYVIYHNAWQVHKGRPEGLGRLPY
jgi:hypothetical protein